MYDGGSMTSPIIGEYCDSTPSSKISSSNRLFIHFHSDFSGTESGFKLEYNATSKNPYKVDSFLLCVYTAYRLYKGNENWNFCYLI